MVTMDFRPVFQVIGVQLSAVAVAMLLPALVDAYANNPDWIVFMASSAITLFVGGALFLSCRTPDFALTVRQSFLLATLSWLVITVFAALPFVFSDMSMSLTDSFFESMSGITTTGSTVIRNLDLAPPGILMWRSMLQWLGGIGIVILAITLFPALRVGGMQMFQTEAVGPTEQVSRSARIGRTLFGVYLALTLGLTLALWLAGMGRFDSLNHAMTIISTGGFSTRDKSLMYWNQADIDMVATFGMILGGLPFLVYHRLLHGQTRRVMRDDQLRWYFSLMALSALGLFAWLVISRDFGLATSLRYGIVTAVSTMTGTGLFTVDFSDWTGLPVTILFFLAFVGGCAGSTSGGIKLFRFHILFANARVQTARLLRPHAVLLPTYNGRRIPDAVADSVMGFLFVYALGFAILAMLMGLMGIELVTALSAAAAAISNVGPGLGPAIGSLSTYADMPTLAKWLLALGMLVGRLEMFVVLVLFVPRFWRP